MTRKNHGEAGGNAASRRSEMPPLPPLPSSPTFDKFLDFARKIVNVPKREIDEQERLYQEKRKQGRE
jgi:hypothetical protein